MTIVVHHFPANQILRVEVLPVGRANVPFLNWRISAKSEALRAAPLDAFAGAGVYGVCFDGQLIYIGSFLGSGGGKVDGVNAATFTGDIVKGRWWQHFGSITGRSHKLSVTPRTLKALADEFGADHPMIAALQLGMPGLGTDAGCLGALERMRFAARHHDEFVCEQPEPAQLLSRFCYVYVRFDELPAEIDAHEFSRRVEDIEIRLIRTLHPEVNTAGRIEGQNPVVVNCTQAGEIILEAMRQVRSKSKKADSEQIELDGDRHTARLSVQPENNGASSAQNLNPRPSANPTLEIHVLPPDDQTPTPRQVFFTSIATSPAAAALVAQVIALCEQLHARDHHTWEREPIRADLRVEANRTRQGPFQQNVVTLDWREKVGYFYCRVLITVDECVQLGVPPENVELNTVTQPLPTKLTVVPGRDNAALFAIIRRSIEKFRGD